MSLESAPGGSAGATGGAAAATTEALAWPVACLLALWDALSLEIGEAAVVTDGHRWSRLAATVAGWYGATPVLFVADGSAAPDGATLVRVEDPSETVRGLIARLHGRPGVAAAELSGRADFVDLLLESIPPSSGLALAGEGREPLTIDFYVNVHRKGLLMVSSVLDPGSPATDAGRDAVPGSTVWPGHLERARRLLANPDRLAESRRALAPVPTHAGPEMRA